MMGLSSQRDNAVPCAPGDADAIEGERHESFDGEGERGVSEKKSSLSSSHHARGHLGASVQSYRTTEPICRRCGRPTGRSARNAVYCLDCMVTQHLERRRAAHAKRRGGSREQYDRVLALWRDGTLSRVLEEVGEC